MDSSIDPLVVVLAVVLIFFFGMAVLLAMAFSLAWRRMPASSPLFGLFSRRVVLVATAAGMVACGLLAAYWIWFVFLYRK